MSINTWEHFFKPETRSGGLVFITNGKVSLYQPSDTEVHVFIRISPALKVIFTSTSVESDTVFVYCKCPNSSKGQFCKHMWAGLLWIEEKAPDFLESKHVLEKKSPGVENKPKFKSVHTESISRVAKQQEYKEAYKAKQAEYRKQQYQKQKQKLKDRKQSKKNLHDEQEFPAYVETALKYFLDNGFPLRETMDPDSIGLAKKKLARIFHPDAGGSHDEIIELNKFTEVLIKFSK